MGDESAAAFDPNTLEPLPPEPPAWPKVIGITSIVIGSIMTMCGACGLFNLAMQGRGPQMEGMTPPPTPPPLLAVVQVAGFFLSVLLLVAGILLTMRREAGRWLHLGYAVIAVPMAILGFIAQFGILEALRRWINENPKMQQMEGIIMMSTYIGFGIGLLIAAYDVFLLVWFGLLKRKADLGARPLSEVI